MIKLQHIIRAQTHHEKVRRRVAQRVKARPVYPSHAVELAYKAELLKLVRLMGRTAHAELMPILRQFTAHDGLTRDLDVTEEVKAKFNEMARKFGNTEAWAKRVSKKTVKQSQEAVDATLAKSINATTGVDVSTIFKDLSPLRVQMDKFTKGNVELITSIPDKYFEQLQQKVTEGIQLGRRHEDFAAMIEERTGVAESRAKLIARDQTSKMNGAFNRVRQTSLGIDSYTWQTAGDERVRETHAENDGKIFRWDNPPEETGNPGDDINCRCVAIPQINLDDF